jgi:hypothetical protein
MAVGKFDGSIFALVMGWAEHLLKFGTFADSCFGEKLTLWILLVVRIGDSLVVVFDIIWFSVSGCVSENFDFVADLVEKKIGVWEMNDQMNDRYLVHGSDLIHD